MGLKGFCALPLNWGIFAKVWRCWLTHWVILLTSSGQKPGMLLNILAQITQPKIPTVPRLKNSSLNIFLILEIMKLKPKKVK